jgi:Type II CAAX prenyl endopeptidase Rce1-like
MDGRLLNILEYYSLDMKVKGFLVYLAIAFGVAWRILATLWLKGISATEPLFKWLSLSPAFLLSIIFGWLRLKIGSVCSVYLAHGTTNKTKARKINNYLNSEVNIS